MLGICDIISRGESYMIIHRPAWPSWVRYCPYQFAKFEFARELPIQTQCLDLLNWSNFPSLNETLALRPLCQKKKEKKKDTCDTWQVGGGEPSLKISALTVLELQVTCDTWHVTPDTWHMTYDVCQVTHGGWWLLCHKLEVPSSNGLGFMMCWI